MRLLQQCLGGFVLLPLVVLALVFWAGGDWIQMAAAAFPVGAALARYALSARGGIATGQNRNLALPWLVLPAVGLAAGMLPLTWTTGDEITSGARLAGFLAFTLLGPRQCAGWRAPLRWLGATAILLVPVDLRWERVTLDSLLAALRIALLADFIRTGLSDRDGRADRLLAAAGIGVIIALQLQVPWLPIAVLAVATAELAAVGALSRQVQAVNPSHRASGRWFSRGRFFASLVVAAILWTWSVAQLASLGHTIHRVGPVLVTSAHRYVQDALASAPADPVRSPAANQREARDGKPREGTGRSAPRPDRSTAANADGANTLPERPSVSPETGDAGAAATPRQGGRGNRPVVPGDPAPPPLRTSPNDPSSPRGTPGAQENERGPGQSDLSSEGAAGAGFPAADATAQDRTAGGGGREKAVGSPGHATEPRTTVGDAPLIPPIVFSANAASDPARPFLQDGAQRDSRGAGNGRGDAFGGTDDSTSSTGSRSSSMASGNAGDARSGANGSGTAGAGGASQSNGASSSAGFSGQGTGSGGAGSGSSLAASSAASASGAGTGQNSASGAGSSGSSGSSGGAASMGGQTGSTGGQGGGGSTGGAGGSSGAQGAQQSSSAGGLAGMTAQPSAGSTGSGSSSESRGSESSVSAGASASSASGGSTLDADPRARSGASGAAGAAGVAAPGKNRDAPSPAGRASATGSGAAAQSLATPQANGTGGATKATVANTPTTTAETGNPTKTKVTETATKTTVADTPTTTAVSDPAKKAAVADTVAKIDVADTAPGSQSEPALRESSPPMAEQTVVVSTATEPSSSAVPIPPPDTFPAPGQEAAEGPLLLRVVRRWMLPGAFALAVALLVTARRFWRKKPTALASSPQRLVEDRRKAGRCLCEIEDLLRRPAPPGIAGELTQLHRVGLRLRYGIEFSRDHVTTVESEIRRLRRALEIFAKRLNAGGERGA